jgi:ribonuclease E
MANKMLIDASHPEETRVVVVRGQRVEEFDFESASRRQLRGNIYLAKVTRVEPSLQAAFVEYGGNRHGFLAFSEIHPDYYQIPVADRQALLEEEARAERDAERDEDRAARRRAEREKTRRHRRSDEILKGEAEDAAASEAIEEPTELGAVAGESDAQASAIDEAEGDPADRDVQISEDDRERVNENIHRALNDGDTATGAPDGAPQELHAETTDEKRREDHATEEERASAAQDQADMAAEAAGDDMAQAAIDAEGEAAASGEAEGSVEVVEAEEPVIEQVGGTDALEEVPERRHRPLRRQYKIQEVIKRRQILLVQVVKEERGNKGAALTTYLSLAGRYSVLMPNTARGGGISRKITNTTDRKRLKELAQELEVPAGMGIILRTAGASRTKAEVKRDFEYLLRLWESVRELTLKSTAPALVYEEGSLIKRAIRDLYNKDIDEIQVAGDDGYREAKEFMRMLMPSHAKAIRLYKETQPVFTHFGVEPQLDAMFSNQVTLRSGGYIVINPTEALVSIDVNSGRATREHSIEDTALKTNLEAAEEIARQLRLRDLAGLIVIDFIDMEERRNNRAVEKRLKDCLKNDRARIQVGSISAFGLLEMSRQRIRTGVLESSSVPCPHCGGSGSMRSTPSIALHVLRSLEDTLIKSATHDLTVRTRTEVALYILNQKRLHLRDLESRFGVSIAILADDTILASGHFALQRGELATRERAGPQAGVRPDTVLTGEETEIEDGELEDIESEGDAEAGERSAEGDEGRRRRRRRRRRGRGDERAPQSGAEIGEQPGAEMAEQSARGRDGADEADDFEQREREQPRDAEAAGEGGRRRRRGRRGGRRNRREFGETFPAETAADDAAPLASAGMDDMFEPGAEDNVTASEAPGESHAAVAAAESDQERPREMRAADAAPPEGPQERAPEQAPPERFERLVEAAPIESVEQPIASVERPIERQELQPEPVAERRVELEPVATPVVEDPNRPKRSGWWLRARANARES